MSCPSARTFEPVSLTVTRCLSGVVTTPSGPRTDTTPRDMTAALCPMHAASARTGHAAYRRIVGRGLVGGVPSAALDRPGPWWCARVVDTRKLSTRGWGLGWTHRNWSISNWSITPRSVVEFRRWPRVRRRATGVVDAYPVLGPDGVVEVSLWVEEDVVVVAVMDHGRWRARPAQDGSRGTSLMNRTTASVVIHHGCRRCKDVQCADPSSGEWRSWDGPFGFCSC